MDGGKKPSIPQVFQGQNILITGATGFVGMVLLEKLLRCCPGVGRIYLIVRSKRGVCLRQRMKDLLERSFFNRCRSERGSITWCCGSAEVAAMGDSAKGPLVVGIAGDIAEKGLGLEENDRLHLELHVTIVYHSAATVRFNEPLRQALYLNTRGTREMLELASRMPLLKEFIHVSTAYAHVSNHHTTIGERFFSVPIEPEYVIKAAEELKDEEYDEIVNRLAGIYHNTYLCTKALTERMIEKDYSQLPISVYRPGIVIACHASPAPGWTTGLQGIGIVISGCAYGFLKRVYCDRRVKPELAPVDHVVNAMLTIVWAKTIDRSNKPVNGMKKRIPIFNHVSSNHMGFSWGEFSQYLNKAIQEDKKTERLNLLKFSSSYMAYEFSSYMTLCFFKLLDIVNNLFGEKSDFARLQMKAKSGIETVAYFMNNQFKFADEGLINLRERYAKEAGTDESGYDSTEFKFDITTVDWNALSKHYITHLRRELAKYQGDLPGVYQKSIQKLKVLGCSLGLVGILLPYVSLYYLTAPFQWIYQSILTMLGNQT
ncbi:fatty acyl-CoA reductase 1-like [Hetaerina americana]|uniref:fatty acyl-CoA reductase 1-like n=1 Tax=Hetaerina americana TaxID=62018 RepID=UPI003A7F5BDF